MRALSARYWEQWNRRSATSPRDSELQGPNTSQTLSPWLLLLLPLTALQIFKEAKYKFPNDSYNDPVYATTNENTKGKQTQTQNNSLKIPWKSMHTNQTKPTNKSNETQTNPQKNQIKPIEKLKLRETNLKLLRNWGKKLWWVAVRKRDTKRSGYGGVGFVSVCLNGLEVAGGVEMEKGNGWCGKIKGEWEWEDQWMPVGWIDVAQSTAASWMES